MYIYIYYTYVYIYIIYICAYRSINKYTYIYIMDTYDRPVFCMLVYMWKNVHLRQVGDKHTEIFTNHFMGM